MAFVRGMWKLLVGIKDGLVLLAMLLFFGLLYAALSSTPNAKAIGEGALLLDLAGTIVEQPAEPDPIALLAGDNSLVREYRRSDLVRALEAAATDNRVKAVALDLDVFTGGGMVALGDVASAIDKVRQAKKPVIAYATGYSDDSYLLAAHASEVWLSPQGGVLITGPAGQYLYYKGLMDKLGVTANIYRVGTYKAAVEPYSRTDMSPAAREANQALSSALWERWLDNVRAARPKAQAAAYAGAPGAAIAAAQGDMAQAALKAGLVDKLGDRSAFGKRVAEIVGAEDADVPGSYKSIAYDDWAAAHPAPTTGEIGVVTVAGTIVDGEAGPGTAAGTTIADIVRKALKERDLKALVVRIDSPGGSTLASEEIRQAVADAKGKGMPVVISMGSVAASGGYWIATVGDRIYAEPDTITGSIGIFGILPSFQGLAQKLGINADGVKITPLSGEPDVVHGPSSEVNQILQLGVESAYRRFITLVSKTRNIPVQRVDEIAQGRVWDGGTARQLGLVDGFGSLEDAIAEAARRAKLDPRSAKAVFLEKEKSWGEKLFESFAAEQPPAESARDVFTRAALRPGMLMTRAVADMEQMMRGSAIQARCLECPAPAAGRERPSSGLMAVLKSWLG
ncbi:MAG TPA: signal peptide peptidase SppA [Allosphingosinicella sp.]